MFSSHHLIKSSNPNSKTTTNKNPTLNNNYSYNKLHQRIFLQDDDVQDYNPPFFLLAGLASGSQQPQGIVSNAYYDEDVEGGSLQRMTALSGHYDGAQQEDEVISGDDGAANLELEKDEYAVDSTATDFSMIMRIIILMMKRLWMKVVVVSSVVTAIGGSTGTGTETGVNVR